MKEVRAPNAQSPLYVMYLDVARPSRPKLLATGILPLHVHYSQVPSPPPASSPRTRPKLLAMPLCGWGQPDHMRWPAWRNCLAAGNAQWLAPPGGTCHGGPPT